MNAPLDAAALGALTGAGRLADDGEGHALARPLTLLILALGGEGGGVLADWIVEAAIAAGVPVQGTSVPGVAQRTGATSYYIEMLREPAHGVAVDSDPPVFCLSPTPGQIDLLVSSELLETARALERGLADPSNTVLISSTSRFLTVGEKMQPGDGRYRDTAIAACAAQCSRAAVLFDMARATREAGTVISAVMFGAIAASGVLPLTRAQCEAQIRRGDRGVDASLRGFDAGFAATRERLQRAGAGSASGETAQGAGALSVAVLPADATAVPGSAIPAAAATVTATAAAAAAAAPRPDDVDGVALPAPVAALARHGVQRLTDFQDAAYARQYLARVRAFVDAEQLRGPTDHAASAEAARSLALWMAYEDVIRVADLNSRAGRFARIRREVKAGDAEPVIVRDFLKPGVDEIAAILPPSLAQRLRGWGQRRGRTTLSEDGIRLQTSAVGGLLLMRMLALLRRVRRHSSRFREEHALIERWSAALMAALPRHAGLAREIAVSPQLIKGYSDTFARGRRSFVAILENLIEQPLPADEAGLAERARAIAEARRAARADPHGRALAGALGLPPAPPVEQPIRFVAKRRPNTAL